MTPKILIYDIETSPLETYTWGIYEQNVSLNQIKKDWHLLSFSAKWFGEKDIIYHDQRKAKDITDDKRLCKELWKLLDESDIVITQNGKAFDQKRVYARFLYHGMNPPSPSKHIDTKQIAKRNFGFTSNSLAHLADKLCDIKKSEHAKFPGMELWKQCLRGNIAAWREMEAYNKRDVVALEALYEKIRAWDTSVSIAEDTAACRSCGGFDFERRGYKMLSGGKYLRLQCRDCGAYCRGAKNLLSKKQREGIKRRC